MSFIDNLFSLKDKSIVITGGSNGNGKAIYDALLKCDANVYNFDIEFGIDITNKNKMNSLFQQIGNVDVLINNAGISCGGYSEESWDRTYEVNLKSVYNLMKIVCEKMKNNGGCSIINITSLNAEMAFPDNPSYVAMKGGLKQLTKAFALDYGKYGIRANNVGPGYIKTRMTEKSWNDFSMQEERTKRTMLGRWGVPEDLVGVIIFLSSNASSYVTGQDFYIDGGWLSKGL